MKSIIKLSGLFALTLALFSCSDQQQKTDAPETKIAGTTVQLSDEQFKNAGIRTDTTIRKPISTLLRLNGRIDVPPQNMISVSIPLGGYLKSTSMLPGKHVSKGEILGVMEDPEYIQLQQDYLVTNAKLVYSSQEQQRQKELNVNKAGSDKALQLAEAEFHSLKIMVSALAEKLRLIGIDPRRLNEKTISRQIVVRSPINGFISKVNGNIGSYVAPSDVLFELINPDDIHLNLTVFEKDLGKLSIGQAAIAYTNNKPDEKHETEIILIGRDLSADRSAEIHCHFQKYDKSLVPGTYMNAEVYLTNEIQSVLPEKSIVSFEGRQYIFIETSSKTYEMKPVEISGSQDGYVALKENPGKQKIVTEGAYSLLMQLKNIAEE